MSSVKLDNRLKCVKAFVSKNSVLMDVGSDHGFLPIACLEDKTSSFAIATDINKDPLTNSIINSHTYGVFDNMSFCLTDGIEDAIAFRYRVTDISICGMGGELIAQILKKSIFVHNENVNLILQPMTKASYLRKWLAKHGYVIVDESICKDNNKLYQVIVCRFSRESYSINDVEALVGPINIKNGSNNAYFKEFIDSCLKSYDKKIKSKKKGKIDYKDDLEFYQSLLSLVSSDENN